MSTTLSTRLRIKWSPDWQSQVLLPLLWPAALCLGTSPAAWCPPSLPSLRWSAPPAPGRTAGGIFWRPVSDRKDGKSANNINYNEITLHFYYTPEQSLDVCCKSPLIPQGGLPESETELVLHKDRGPPTPLALELVSQHLQVHTERLESLYDLMQHISKAYSIIKHFMDFILSSFRVLYLCLYSYFSTFSYIVRQHNNFPQYIYIYKVLSNNNS